MLELILGRAGTGKSRYMLEQLKTRAERGLFSMLLVPEQSSFVWEKKLFLELGPKRSALVSVKSFRKLGDDILKIAGGGALVRVDDALRAALMGRAIDCCADLGYYRRHKRDAAFCAAMASAVNELKNGGVGPAQLAAFGDLASSELSRQKLAEIAKIYAAYEHELEAGFCDAADALSAAAQKAAGAGVFKDTAVFADGFTGFTEPEKQLLLAALENAGSVHVALVCERSGANAGVFKTPGDTMKWLERAARERGVSIDYKEFTEPVRFLSPGLAAAERHFGGLELAPADAADGLFYYGAEDFYDECELCCAEIERLVREDGYDYADIAVVLRDPSDYRAPIRRTFARYGIPLFCDWGSDLRFHPGVLYIRAALELLGGFDTETLLRYAKTPLSGLSPADAALLDNYAFVWDLDGDEWLAPFTKHPTGFSDELDDAARVLLERTESARRQLVEPLFFFEKAAVGKRGGEIISELYKLMEKTGAARALREVETPEAAAESAAVFSLLDRLYNLYEGAEVSGAELSEMMGLFASAADVGEIPATMQQLQLGGADRMRTDNPRAVFMLGLAEGVFPRTEFDSPVLSFAERELINENGGNLALEFGRRLNMEQFYVYRAASAARERLYLSCPKTGKNGESLECAAALESLLKTLDIEPPPAARDSLLRVTNLATAKQHYARLLEEGDASGPAAGEIGLGEFAALLEQAAAAPRYEVDSAAAQRALLGEQLSISPTRIETFSQCRFSYFLRYALGIRPLKKAEMSPIEAGSFVHSVVEQIMKKTNGDLASVSEEQLDELCAQSSAEYVESRLGESAKLPRLRYLIERLTNQTKRLARKLREEAMQMQFEPRDFELAIARDGDVEPLALTTPDGNRVFVEGKVDRVDILRAESGNYIRVIDYKTGQKKFSLDEVFYGLNMQMLVYLFSLCETGKARYGDPLPAGILYVPADPGIPDSDGAAEPYRMDGLVLGDERIVRAMEKDGAGVFLPVGLDKNGNLKKSQKLASLEEMGRLKSHIDNTIIEMASALYAGEVDAAPFEWGGAKRPCDYCDYSAVCRRDRVEKSRALQKGAGDALLGRKEGGDGV